LAVHGGAESGVVLGRRQGGGRVLQILTLPSRMGIQNKSKQVYSYFLRKIRIHIDFRGTFGLLKRLKWGRHTGSQQVKLTCWTGAGTTK